MQQIKFQKKLINNTFNELDEACNKDTKKIIKNNESVNLARLALFAIFKKSSNFKSNFLIFKAN